MTVDNVSNRLHSEAVIISVFLGDRKSILNLNLTDIRVFLHDVDTADCAWDFQSDDSGIFLFHFHRGFDCIVDDVSEEGVNFLFRNEVKKLAIDDAIKENAVFLTNEWLLCEDGIQSDITCLHFGVIDADLMFNRFQLFLVDIADIFLQLSDLMT